MNACNLPREGSSSDLVALLRERACRQPDQWALSFLVDGEKAEVRRTYAELDLEARAIAANLQRFCQAGQPALLLYAPGLEFVSAFLGCLYAGVVAVPTHLPHARREPRQLRAIAADAAPKTVLTSAALLPELKARCPRDSLLGNARWLNSDNVDLAMAEQWRPPNLTAHTVACLQYTSGSTADPKGVVLTHTNLLSNSQLIHDAFGHKPSSVGVIWLPPYHDMGLIGGVLQPLFGGFPVVLMSPVHVVQSPLRWLRALSRFRATTSGGRTSSTTCASRGFLPKRPLPWICPTGPSPSMARSPFGKKPSLDLPRSSRPAGSVARRSFRATDLPRQRFTCRGGPNRDRLWCEAWIRPPCRSGEQQSGRCSLLVGSRCLAADSLHWDRTC